MRETSLLVSCLALTLSAAALTACSGSDDPAAGTPDAGVHLPDAAGNTTPDAAGPGGCTVAAQLTLTPDMNNSAAVLAPAVGGAMPRPENYRFVYITGAGMPMADEFLQFTVDTPVTIGATLDLAQGCTQASKFCWVMLGNFTVDGMMNVNGGDFFFARAGTVKVTEAGPAGGKFKATVSGVRFDHFIRNANNQLVPANDTCKTTLADTSIDAVVMAGMKPGQPGSAPTMPAYVAPADLVLP